MFFKGLVIGESNSAVDIVVNTTVRPGKPTAFTAVSAG